MNKITLLLLVFIVAAFTGLSLLSQHYTGVKIAAEEKKRNERNILQEVIDSTHNTDPVFNESLKGKMVVLNISIPMMPSCKRQLPGFNQLALDFGKNKDVVFLGLFPGDTTFAKRMLGNENMHFNYRVVYDNGKLLSLFSSLGGATSGVKIFEPKAPLPIDVVINREGKIQLLYQGDKPWAIDDIRKYLSTAVNGQ